MCGDFLFSILFFSYFQLPLLFKCFLLFCFHFYFKEDNKFYIHFQRGSPQQWIRAKGSSKSFLTKAPTPPWHHWEQSTHFFPFFWLFFYLFMLYISSFIYLSCIFTILYRFTIFLCFFLYFFSLFSPLNCESNQIEKQITKEECVISRLAEIASCSYNQELYSKLTFSFRTFSFKLSFFHKPWTKKIKSYFKSKKIISAQTPAKDSTANYANGMKSIYFSSAVLMRLQIYRTKLSCNVVSNRGFVCLKAIGKLSYCV